MQTLTKAEEQVMVLLWDKEKAFVKELVDAMPEPRPAYNTVSTVIRILEKKGFVGHEEWGKSHRYYPLISREAYSRFTLSDIKEKLFSGSATGLLSFFARNENIDKAELEQLLQELRKKSEQ